MQYKLADRRAGAHTSRSDGVSGCLGQGIPDTKEILKIGSQIAKFGPSQPKCLSLLSTFERFSQTPLFQCHGANAIMRANLMQNFIMLHEAGIAVQTGAKRQCAGSPH